MVDTSIRRDYSPKIRALLKQIGDKKIKHLMIQRVPVSTVIKALLDVITLGNYSSTTKKIGYDKVFHLSLICTLDNNGRYIIEKNEVINISKNIPSSHQGSEQIDVPSFQEGEGLTVAEFLNNTKIKQGSSFFLYDAFNRNCQMFIQDLLKNSNLLTTELNEFIIQDAKTILKGLPFYTQYLAKGITDLGAQFNVMLYGRSIKIKKSKSKIKKIEIEKSILDKLKQFYLKNV